MAFCGTAGKYLFVSLNFASTRVSERYRFVVGLNGRSHDSSSPLRSVREAFLNEVLPPTALSTTISSFVSIVNSAKLIRLQPNGVAFAPISNCLLRDALRLRFG